MDARQRPPGAADQVKVAPDALGEPGHGGKFGFGDGAGAHRIVAGALGQPDHAEAQRLRRAAHAMVKPHHFERAAADIGEDAVGGRDAAQHAEGGHTPPPRCRAAR